MGISKEVKVGLFMAVSLVLLYFGFNFLKGIDFFSSTHRYYAVYSNVDKLMPSNQVFINGYAVGRVSKIQFQQAKNRVVVEMEIDSEIILGDSTIALLNGDILGTKYIQLNVGSIANPIQPKDTLRSQVAKGIADFLAENAAPVADNLEGTLRKLNTILDNLAGNSAKLDAMFDEFGKTPKILNKTLNNTNSKVDALADNIQAVTLNINGVLSELKPTLTNVRVFSDSLKALEIQSTLNRAKDALGKLDAAVSKFDRKDNTLGKLMNEDSLYVNLNKMILDLDVLAKHLNENPNHFFAPLGKKREKIQRDLERQRKESQK
ncbi:MAG TPA: MlaD family protein [Cyclobacteriaceae bacterium]|nr:MlaD family protein [Cyclobacteriaceae bacterium]HMV09714.1 MlaD family protein [Cyclobacteriaceae bacterium]HMV89381.1 MlaD family protein [Cyclobacteriaceae bacterium]HMX02267.1 MlaD family protein [Cyclobacteriaceae bacterium]HMX51192.1 MlaD family protein [Cyclobacteriaceae bacterium]